MEPALPVNTLQAAFATLLVILTATIAYGIRAIVAGKIVSTSVVESRLAQAATEANVRAEMAAKALTMMTEDRDFFRSIAMRALIAAEASTSLPPANQDKDG